MAEQSPPVALVTGGSRSLGRAISLEFARRGHFVAINYRSNAGEAERTLRLIEAAGGQGRTYAADVGQPDQVRKLITDVHRDRGRIDVLVNNAGITRDELFMLMRRESWRDTLQTNLDAVFHSCKAVIRLMCAARRGVIINIGSGSAISPRPGQVNYSSSKSGLIGFTKSLAREVAERGVRVVTVAPGFIETDMSSILPARVLEETLRLIPIGRWGHPDEIAGVVGFVASEEASFLTGQTLVIDGGRAAVEAEYGFPVDLPNI